MRAPDFEIERYLEECRRLALAEIKRVMPSDRRETGGLYRLMLDYPMRPAKALRPALCMSICLALGGHADAVLPSAAAFELFHNAFLVHDDVEDGSHLRRHAPTLHEAHGVPIAVNVGDGMLALALQPLLDNVRALGLSAALRILQIFARMARESAEGQMIELDWTRKHRWDIADREYLGMVHKKTGWYSFIAPVTVGAIAAGAEETTTAMLGRCALLLGIAFQIQDDMLGLDGADGVAGKDPLGDLWEGKCTLALLHTLRSARSDERERAIAILRRARPASENQRGHEWFEKKRRLLRKIEAISHGLSVSERRLLEGSLLGTGDDEPKQTEDVQWLAKLMGGRDGAGPRYARAVARRHAARAGHLLERGLAGVPDSVHKVFLRSLIEFVIDRTH